MNDFKLMEFNDDVMRKIAECVTYGDENKLTEKELHFIRDSMTDVEGHIKRMVEIPDGYNVTYIVSIGDDGTALRSISIVNFDSNSYATPGMCEILLDLYGFKTPIDKCLKQIKRRSDGKVYINIFEIDENNA